MRVVHLEKLVRAGVVKPLCGDWGSMDTDWTAEPDGVTCPACRLALEAAGAPAPARAPGAPS